jgi:hypothetical protein
MRRAKQEAMEISADCAVEVVINSAGAFLLRVKPTEKAYFTAKELQRIINRGRKESKNSEQSDRRSS